MGNLDRRMLELNRTCRKCIAEKQRRFEDLQPQHCHFCPIGQEIHQIDVQLKNGWETVDWTNFQFKEFYHG